MRKMFDFPLIAQLARFGVVGTLAALVHFCSVVLLVQYFGFMPLTANILGFAMGVQVSYWGHRTWTFRGTSVAHHAAYPKLVLLQTANFTVNESLFYFFLSLHIPYPVALLLVLTILPMFTFMASKMWIFV